MNSIKKFFATSILVFSTFAFNAQVSQDEIAAKWENGEKTCYGNWGTTEELNLIDKEQKAKVEIKFDENKKVTSVYIGGTNLSGTYESFGKSATDFVRYYGHYYTNKLFFTNSSIIIYESTETLDKTEVKIRGCIGKKINQKDVNNLVSFLTSTKKYWVPINIDGISDKVTKVNVIPIYLDGNEELLPGEKFEVEFEVELEWGVKLKSKGLKGHYGVTSFKLESNDISFEIIKRNGNDVYSCVSDCPYIIDNTLNIKGTVGNSSVKFSKSIPINCDLDKSPGITEARKWSQYGSILFEYTEKGEIKKKSFVAENGFLRYSDWFLWLIKNYKDDKTFLVRVSKDGKFGYADVNSKLVIPCEYENGSTGKTFNDKLISVKKGGKWGYVDFQNKVIVPFKYDDNSDFYNGMGIVYLGNKIGYVNSKGVEVVKTIYDKGWNFTNGAAVVMKDGKYGFVNETGATLGSIVYDDAFNFDSNKFGYVKTGKNYGVIDFSGKLIVPIDHEDIPFSINADLICVSKNSLLGVMNRAGKIVVDFKYTKIYPVGKTVFGDKKSRDSEKVFRVRKDGQYGFLKTDGTVLSECIFFEAEDFFDGLAKVETYENGITKKGHYSLSTKNINWYEEIDHRPKESDNASVSNSGSKSKSGSDKKTLKNTGKNPLYYRTSKGGSASHLNGGSSTSVSCSSPIYYCNDDGRGNHSVTGSLISGANQDCGSTVTAQGGN